MTTILLALAILAVTIWLTGLAFARADWGGMHVNWLDGWARIFCKVLHGLGQQRLDLPASGPAVVVANHVSGVDPVMLIAASDRPLHFLIAREQYERFGLHWLFKKAGCIPVDRSGRPETALRQAMRALDEGKVIALFPHGRIRLDDEPSRPVKAGFARLAEHADAPVLAVRIDGVRAQGQILLAPWVPDRITLTSRWMPACRNTPLKDCLSAVQQYIDTPVRPPK